MFKKLIKKIKKKSLERKKRKAKRIKGKYPNRFLKFYHLNQERLSKERRSLYRKKKKSGICTRCKRKVVKGIVFCKYHQQKQKEYNKKARLK